MVRIEGEVIINRPVEGVFDFVADERNEPRYNLQMLRVEQISPGPIGLGTKFRAESKSMGRTVEMTIEFTTFERPRRLASSTHLSTLHIQGTLTFDPVPEGTRMHWSWELEPQGIFKLMAPIIARVGRRQEETIWTGLKHLLEEQKTPELQTQVGRRQSTHE
jgi:Polyketide cyclase / dehydrase and lipid transport